MREELQLIGVDCATDPRKTGLCLGRFTKGRLNIEEVRLGDDEDSMLRCLLGWLDSPTRTLIGLDAPLGWPDALRNTLPDHRAGQGTGHDSRAMFSRVTDAFIQKHPCFGKWPLEVGANFIARTANHTLALLDELRRELKLPVGLAWDPETWSKVAAIEVYPWATLVAHGVEVPSYKLKGQRDGRAQILEGLLNESVDIAEAARCCCLESADALDSVVAALAVADFVRGHAMGPPEEMTEVARREGWIWVKEPAI